jgi:hypothetical protein
MSATISRPFRFTEFKLFDVPSSDESTWKPVKLPDTAAPQLVTGKWIYAFQLLGSNTQLFVELFADDKGELSALAGSDARAKERDQRAKPGKVGGSSFTLPHTINGKRAYYFFVVTRIRMPSDCVSNFETNKPRGLGPALDLDRDDAYLLVAGSDGNSTTMEAFLPVIDPITIGLNLHDRYESAANELLAYTMEYEEQSDAQRRRVLNRHKELLFAKLLKSVVESDPTDKLGLKNEFKNDDPTAPARYIQTYESTVNQLITKRDKAVEPLVHFTNHKGALFTAIEDCYRVFEQQDYHAWLNVYGEMTDRISEAPLGKARIGKLIDSPNYAFGEYVLRTTPAPELQFSVGRKCPAAIVGLWSEAVPGMLSKHPGAAALLANALKHIAHIELVKVETKTISYKYRKKNGRMRTVTKTVTETTAIDPANALGKWAEEGVPGKALGHLIKAIEVANLLMSVVALAESEPGEDRGFALLNLLGSVLDGVSAFNAFLKIGKRSIKVVGGISAAIDTVLATRDGYKAYEHDDASSAVGYGIVATGSVFTLAGCVCAAAGLAAGATVVGIPLAAFLEIVGAVLVAAGWLLAVFTADSAIELFTNHCKFGKHSNSTSNDRPQWASAPFGQWSNEGDGLDHQVKSLLTLLAAFTVKATDYNAIEVQLGLVMSDSRLKVKFACVYNLGITHSPELMVDIGEKTVTQIGGDPQDLSQCSVVEQNGRPYVRITADWPSNQRPSNAIQHQRADAAIQLLLNEAGAVVPLGGPLNYVVHRLGSILPGPKSSYS